MNDQEQGTPAQDLGRSDQGHPPRASTRAAAAGMIVAVSSQYSPALGSDAGPRREDRGQQGQTGPPGAESGTGLDPLADPPPGDQPSATDRGPGTRASNPTRSTTSGRVRPGSTHRPRSRTRAARIAGATRVRDRLRRPAAGDRSRGCGGSRGRSLGDHPGSRRGNRSEESGDIALDVRGQSSLDAGGAIGGVARKS